MNTSIKKHDKNLRHSFQSKIARMSSSIPKSKLCHCCMKQKAKHRITLSDQRVVQSCKVCLPIYQRSPDQLHQMPVGFDAKVYDKLCQICTMKKATKKIHLQDGQ